MRDEVLADRADGRSRDGRPSRRSEAVLAGAASVAADLAQQVAAGAHDGDELGRLAGRLESLEPALAATTPSPAPTASRRRRRHGVAAQAGRACRVACTARRCAPPSSWCASPASWCWSTATTSPSSAGRGSTLEEQRERCIDAARTSPGDSGTHIAVVFDGATVRGRRGARAPAGAGGVLAGGRDRRRRAARRGRRARPTTRPVVVVTNDQAVLDRRARDGRQHAHQRAVARARPPLSPARRPASTVSHPWRMITVHER